MKLGEGNVFTGVILFRGVGMHVWSQVPSRGVGMPGGYVQGVGIPEGRVYQRGGYTRESGCPILFSLAQFFFCEIYLTRSHLLKFFT